MSDYTILRAAEAPDFTGGSPSPFLGYARPMGAEQIAVNVRVLAPGASHVPPDVDPATGHSHKTIEELYHCAFNLGTIWKDTERTADAERSYARSIELNDALARRFPAEPKYAFRRAESSNNLGVLRRLTGRPAEAQRDYEAALAALEPLAAVYGGSRDLAGNRLLRNVRDAGRLPLGEEDVDHRLPLRAPHRLEEQLPLAVEPVVEAADVGGCLHALDDQLGRALAAHPPAADARRALAPGRGGIRARLRDRQPAHDRHQAALHQRAR